MKKYIFLDFDGVLNRFGSEEMTTENRIGGFVGLDHRIVPRLNRLVEETDAEIVVSSTWRNMTFDEVVPGVPTLHALRFLLFANGLRHPKKVVDCTPKLWTDRGHEIQEWLTARLALEPEGERIATFVILDDSDDMVHLLPRLIRTDPRVGLTDEDVDRAIGMLNGEEEKEERAA